MDKDLLEHRALLGKPEDQAAFASHLIDLNAGPESDKQAFLYSKKAADVGLAEGQYLLGWLFDNGRGTDQIRTKAAYWYHKAVDQNHAKAMLNLGILYRGGLCADGGLYGSVFGEEDNVFAKGLFFDAYEAFQVAASKGDAEAWYKLGTMWQYSYGVPKDLAEAFECYCKAAELGYVSAHVDAGYMIENGLGTHKDQAKAVEHYRTAAAAGNVFGQNNYGLCLLYGNGCARNPSEGLRMLTIAAEHGHGCAQNNLGWAYENGHDVTPDLDKAVRWYRMSAIQSNSAAVQSLHRLHTSNRVSDSGTQENAVDFRILGIGLYNGSYGLPADEGTAFKYISRAADLGDATAQDWVSWAYTYGKGCEKDDRQAFEWASKAAAQDVAASFFKLGLMYLNGNGVKQSDYRAFECFKQAAEAGNWDGMDRTGWCYKEGRGTAQELDQAYSHFLKAAECGHTNALKNLVALCRDHKIRNQNETIIGLTDWDGENIDYLSRFSGLRWLGLCFLDSSNCASLLSQDAFKTLRHLAISKYVVTSDMRWPKGVRALDIRPEESNIKEVVEQDTSLTSITELRALKYWSTRSTQLHLPRRLAYLHLDQLVDAWDPASFEHLRELRVTVPDYCCSMEAAETLATKWEARVIPSSVLSLTFANRLSKLPEMCENSELRSLSATGTTLCDISALAQCAKLVKLDLSGMFALLLKGGATAATNRIASLQAIKGCRRLATVNLKVCSNITSIEPLSNCYGLEELDLTACWKLRDICAISSLPNLRSLKMNGCTNIRDLDALASCASLVDLECDADPYGAEAVKIATAILRQDRESIKTGLSWAQGVVEFPKQPELLFSRYVRATALYATENWAFDGLWKLLAALRKREGLRRTFWKDVFTECLSFPCGRIKDLFEAVLEGADPSVLAGSLLQPALSVLAASQETTGEWAVGLVDGLLKNVSKDRLRELAPDICLFYAKSRQNERLRDWIQVFTEDADTGWSDKIQAALAKWELETGQIQPARTRLASIRGKIEADQVRAALARKLAVDTPAEAGAMLEEIADDITKHALAAELAAVPSFTLSLENTYRLFLTLESDPQQLAELVEHLTEDHPNSQFVKALAKTFSDGSTATQVPPELAAEAVLNCDVVRDLLSPKTVRQLADEANAKRTQVARDAIPAYVGSLVSRNLISATDAEHILRQFHERTNS